jgi:hypothetical protein
MVPFSERLSVAPDVLFRLVGDEGVLLNLNTTLYLGLNPVGPPLPKDSHRRTDMIGTTVSRCSR